MWKVQLEGSSPLQEVWVATSPVGVDKRKSKGGAQKVAEKTHIHVNVHLHKHMEVLLLGSFYVMVQVNQDKTMTK